MPLFLESQWQARTEEIEEKEKKEKEKKKGERDYEGILCFCHQ